MRAFIQLLTAGNDTGPFLIFSNVDCYFHAYGPYTKADLLNGIYVDLPDGTITVIVKSNGKCVNDICLILPTTTTTCAPQEFKMLSQNLTSVTFSTFVSSAPVEIIWDSNTTETWNPGDPVPTHTYSTSYTGPIKIKSCTLNTISDFSFQNTSSVLQPSGGKLIIQDIELTKLTGLLYCTLNAPNVYFLQSSSTQTSTQLLPKTLITFWTEDNNMNGDIHDLPPNVINFICHGQNIITGIVNNIPRTIEYFEVTGLNTISGLVGDMPLSTISFVVFGLNTIGGSLSDIPGASGTPTQSNTNPNLVILNVLGNTTIHGDLSNMNWNILRVFNIAGPQDMCHSPLWAGNPIGLCSYITGDLDALPRIQAPNGDGTRPFRNDFLVFGHVFGYNTITGNINNFPPGTNEISISGEDSCGLLYGNTIYGNLSDVPSTNMHTFFLNGRNTITGAISTYDPTNITLDTFSIGGLNTLSGNLSDLPINVRRVDIQGNNTINTYSPSRTWQAGPNPPYGGIPGSMCYFVFDSASIGKLNNQSEVSQLVIDLNNTSTWLNYGTILSNVKIKGNTSLTPAGNTALSQLNTKVLNASGGVNTANVIP